MDAHHRLLVLGSKLATIEHRIMNAGEDPGTASAQSRSGCSGTQSTFP